eukprot:CAMPEP_0178458542 /NCGR_PEP_ID=MMETSP0689_2-20121128/47600_1 /TAXON_ID=160604 /ORGANISM="Amphidinium massartii, Strain CS-259" /LENGTH=91 /DNA_ID=CAMNT_0020084855 /DNA_START=537 /DNA_END=812 /DNA_ORIENTATION=-
MHMPSVEDLVREGRHGIVHDLRNAEVCFLEPCSVGDLDCILNPLCDEHSRCRSQDLGNVNHLPELLLHSFRKLLPGSLTMESLTLKIELIH